MASHRTKPLAATEPQSPRDIARMAATRAFAPASVLTNAAGEVLFSLGPRSRLLAIPAGEPTNNVMDLVVPGLRPSLAHAMAQALNTVSVVALENQPAITETGPLEVVLRVESLGHGSETMLLISFQEHAPAEARPALPSTTTVASLARENHVLSEELESIREELMHAREQNGQLQAALNMQLQTVADLRNILDASCTATIVLDSDLKIQLFTTAALRLFNLRETDVGRPLADLAALVVDPNLLTDARTVLGTQEPLAREVAGPGGTWFMHRARPYRDAQTRLAGVIITFADISNIKTASHALEVARLHATQIIQAICHPLVVLDGQLHLRDANDAFLSLFATPGAATAPNRLASLDAAHHALMTLLADQPLLQSFLSAAEGEAPAGLEVSAKVLLPGQGWRHLLLTAGRVTSAAPHERETVLSIEDVTEQEQIAVRLAAARVSAEQQNLDKSRFLAAASHDLRQPLQSMSMLLGILAAKTGPDDLLGIVHRLDNTVVAMSGILDALLDVNQLEAGKVRASLADVSLDSLLTALDSEFNDGARAIGLGWRVMPCSAVIRTDVRLLRQVLRNFISNALKYTRRGRVLVGCRRLPGHIRIEVWDCGIGIPPNQQQMIFEEFHQVENAARASGRGVGLGLAITQRLANLLRHPLSVRSVEGKGSVFAIEVPLGRGRQDVTAFPGTASAAAPLILVIDDDPDVGEAMTMLLQEVGHVVMLARDGPQAIRMASEHPPSLIIADQNLSCGMTGIEVVEHARQASDSQASDFPPGIILTGDTSARMMREIEVRQMEHARKPIAAEELLQRVRRLLPPPPLWDAGPLMLGTRQGYVFIVDDDAELRTTTAAWLASLGWTTETFASTMAFLASDHPGRRGCVLIDALMDGGDGMRLLEKLRPHAKRLAPIVITGLGDVRLAVAAIMGGATDFIEKPIQRRHLQDSIQRAMSVITDQAGDALLKAGTQDKLRKLTERQGEILERVIAGQSSKVIAAGLNISTRTVENHRAAIMVRLGARSLPELIRTVVSSQASGGAPPAT